MPKTPQERARAGMQRHRKKLAKQGRKQISIYLSTEALTVLEALCQQYGLDRSRTLDAVLLNRPKRKRQPIDMDDLFGNDDN